MEAKDRRFMDSAVARAYVSNLAYWFDDPEDLINFGRACDIAQAALLRLLMQETIYYRTYDARCGDGVPRAHEMQPEIDDAWNKILDAADEFQLAREQLRQIIDKLELLTN